ncbi:unnamed protein product, partial [Pylaiella littoralis]
YPKGKRSARDWVAEVTFARAWRPSRERVGGDSSMDADVNMDANEGPAPSREKRPRDCPQKSDPSPPEHRGGAREGSGRPKGSFGPKRNR